MEGEKLEEKTVKKKLFNEIMKCWILNPKELSTFEETRTVAMKSAYELFQMYSDSEITNLLTEETLRLYDTFLIQNGRREI